MPLLQEFCNSKKNNKSQRIFKISGFHRAFFKVSHFYWPTNALNFIKLKG